LGLIKLYIVRCIDDIRTEVDYKDKIADSEIMVDDNIIV